MKNLLVVVILLVTTSAASASEKSKLSAKRSSRGTDFRFTGQEIGGKYQTAGEAIATVENEKPLLNIIEPRREFKDRLRKSVSQR